jgi:hypothetical protein
MNKNTKDILAHSIASVAMIIILLSLPHLIAITLAVVMGWYMWETGQRIAKDYQKRGLFYWWNMARWSDQARLEFLVPSVVATVALNLYVIMTM